MIKKFILLNMAILCFCIFFSGFFSKAQAAGNKLQILTSTFPIRQIVLNIVRGRKNVNVDLLIPAQVGCPHDYSLAPQDMKKLAEADVLIINGLGMEDFLGAALKKAGSSLIIIDSSAGSKDIFYYSDGSRHKEHAHESDKHEHECRPQRHACPNPHLFASPRMAALLAINIAKGLSVTDPSGKEIYLNNASVYAGKMNKLADNFLILGKSLKNNRIVTQHGVFDYLARDMELRIVAVIQEHAGQEPSAGEILKIIKTIRNNNAKAIFTEPQYPKNIGRTIAREAGIAIDTLDPVANGPKNAPLNYYETVMRKNLKILEKTLNE